MRHAFTSRAGVLDGDTRVNAWGCWITIPAGTRVRTIESGAVRLDHPHPGYEWAVADVKLLKQLTGNDHDPVYRYLCVPSGTPVSRPG